MTHTVCAPAGMSYVNAFKALWDNAHPTVLFSNDSNLRCRAEDEVATADKVHQLFQGHASFRIENVSYSNHTLYVKYAGGRAIKTFFESYPVLDVAEYDALYGQGAAQKALEKYSKVPPQKRFDINDQYQFVQLHLGDDTQDN